MVDIAAVVAAGSDEDLSEYIEDDILVSDNRCDSFSNGWYFC